MGVVQRLPETAILCQIPVMRPARLSNLRVEPCAISPGQSRDHSLPSQGRYGHLNSTSAFPSVIHTPHAIGSPTHVHASTAPSDTPPRPIP